MEGSRAESGAVHKNNFSIESELVNFNIDFRGFRTESLLLPPKRQAGRSNKRE
jgi:hypothetical protein